MEDLEPNEDRLLLPLQHTKNLQTNTEVDKVSEDSSNIQLVKYGHSNFVKKKKPGQAFDDTPFLVHLNHQENFLNQTIEMIL